MVRKTSSRLGRCNSTVPISTAAASSRVSLEGGAADADRVVFLADGERVDELADPTAPAVLEKMKHLDGRAA